MNSRSLTERRGIAWFVSRHLGAIDWAKRQHLVIDRWVEHLDTAEVNSEDVVIGTLPVNLAAEVCKRGARYLHLALKVPMEWRGRELSSDDLQHLGVQIEAYRIDQLTHDSPAEIS